MYVKETIELTRKTEECIQKQFNEITSIPITIGKKTLNIKIHSHLTMLDGKAANAISECNSSRRCNLCDLIGLEFNDMDKIKENLKKVKDEYFKLGLSTLHALY